MNFSFLKIFFWNFFLKIWNAGGGGGSDGESDGESEGGSDGGSGPNSQSGPKWPKIPASHLSPQNFKSSFFLGHPVVGVKL